MEEEESFIPDPDLPQPFAGESEEPPETEPEPEPLPPEPVQRRRRRKPVVEATPEPKTEDVDEPVEESTEAVEEESAPEPKPKRGRPSKQKPRKIMGPEVKERQKRAVVFEESPQNVTVREAEPEEVISPFQEPLMVDADDTTPPLEIDLDAVPVRRVRVEPQLARYAPPEEPESVEDVEEGEDLQQEAHLPVLLTSDELMKTLCGLLDQGYSLEMHKVGNRYVLKKGAQKIPRGKFQMTKVEADEEASTDEYKEFTAMWDELSTEERIAYAEKIGAKWDGQLHQRSAMGRLKRCALVASGIQKWKPEYRDAKTRTRLWKEGIRAKPL